MLDMTDRASEKTQRRECMLTHYDIKSSITQDRSFYLVGKILHNERLNNFILQELTVLKRKFLKAAP